MWNMGLNLIDLEENIFDEFSLSDWVTTLATERTYHLKISNLKI